MNKKKSTGFPVLFCAECEEDWKNGDPPFSFIKSPQHKRLFYIVGSNHYNFTTSPVSVFTSPMFFTYFKMPD